MIIHIVIKGDLIAYYFGNQKVCEGVDLSANALLDAFRHYGIVDMSDPIMSIDPHSSEMPPDRLTREFYDARLA